jgi:hypothetical protein
MNKEEIELNAAMWEHYTDEQIKAIEQTLVQQIPPQKMEMYAKWMIRGSNDIEITKWLSEVKKIAPVHVFALLDRIAKSELTEIRYKGIFRMVEATEAPVRA